MSERHLYILAVGNPKERSQLEEQGVDGKILLKWILKKWDGDIDCIDLAQDTDRWRALVNTIMSLRVPRNAVNLLTS